MYLSNVLGRPAKLGQILKKLSNHAIYVFGNLTVLGKLQDKCGTLHELFNKLVIIVSAVYDYLASNLLT